MNVTYPGIGRRLASLLYESLVVTALVLIGFLIPQSALSTQGIVLGGKFLWAHIFLLLMAYFVWSWLKNGQTLPMKTWKLQLVDRNGGRLRPAQALLRYCAAWPSMLLFGCGIFWAIFDKDRQFLHDRIAGTRIIAKSE